MGVGGWVKGGWRGRGEGRDGSGGLCGAIEMRACERRECGRGVFATRDLRVGELLLVEKAFMVVFGGGVEREGDGGGEIEGNGEGGSGAMCEEKVSWLSCACEDGADDDSSRQTATLYSKDTISSILLTKRRCDSAPNSPPKHSSISTGTRVCNPPSQLSTPAQTLMKTSIQKPDR